MNFKQNKYYIFLVSLLVLDKYNNNAGACKSKNSLNEESYISTNLISFKNVTNYRILEEALMDVENVKENLKYVQQAKMEENELNVEGNAQKESPIPSVKSKSELIEEKKKINETSAFITDELVTKYLNICDSVHNNTFIYNNDESFNKSEDCTLHKNLIDEKNNSNYEIIGHGKLNDVSVYGMNYALSNISAIKEWNTHISYLNYLNLTKETIEDKIKRHEKIDPSKYTLNDANMLNNNSYLYLINGLPWPFRSHDAPYEYYQKYFPDKNMILIVNRSIKNAFKDVSGYTRIRNYESFFCLYPKTNDMYTPGLDYVSSILYDVSIPPFLKNSILNQLFPKLILDLNQSSRKYTKVGLSLTDEEKASYLLSLQIKGDNKKLKSVDNKIKNSLNSADNKIKNSLNSADNTEKLNILWIIFVNPVYKIIEICTSFIQKTISIFQ
ncbi:StAR-related lipid transfer protein, putative [Plasmodium berghei]|uniref:StAR-related lipid transfer protein, putative n=2 Tax=Plasmodium berghei TaxID=5821 RepID=A0A509AGP0_PLABA|nr:StAR-related lipid transfer protein, putative [Plasmodium berghei ANKA]CXH88439.1 StAR-related lipid transfer protein, putative [Plasmodium berghei]SCL90187.1 StAR-related lipid transfer protein, putative [Plasmodium berghei]SCM15240.1 StAR-related lipid transfer protein, putative [Plasmodium berghei]SCM17035.1 StAR-related lipid transfer protein, putative [Plasmodium berghei]SCN21895.1 StAR-related lipid transfer protein, putative [Plasmodium berghei]|eukprot:XP_034419815.1 StAR-related lipid transfer protein, putative [Plasmodium berghei ANKA]